MTIHALRKYQQPHRRGRFADLSAGQRAQAEAHYQRLCARWGENLPPWRRAILAGRAKDLVLRPRDPSWGRRLRTGRKRQPADVPVATTGASSPSPTQSPTDTTRPVPARSNRVTPTTLAALTSTDNRLATLVTPPSDSPALDARGVTASGTDGYDTAQRILRNLASHAFGRSTHFTMAVPGNDLPRRWVWHLTVHPVP